MRVRLFAAALLSVFVLLIGAAPCAAMLAARAGDAHECCNHSDSHSGAPKSNCELRCVAGSLPFTTADKTWVHSHSPVTVTILDADSLASSAPAPERFEERRAPDHGPPLYVAHAALLI